MSIKNKIEYYKYKLQMKFATYRQVFYLQEQHENLLTVIGELRYENSKFKSLYDTQKQNIAELKEEILNTVNDLNLLGDKLTEKENTVKEMIRRRDEVIKRIQIKVPPTNNFPAYKYWISEPFIKDSFEEYTESKDEIIDEISALKGLDNALKQFNESRTV